MITKTHFYPTPPESPWPALISLYIISIALSGISFIKFSNTTNIVTTCIIATTATFGWWVTFKRELVNIGINRKVLETSLKFSIIIFITSEILFFFSMFWAYEHFNLVPEIEIGSLWPPLLIKMFNSFRTPGLNTALLLTSGVTVTLAHKLILRKKKNIFIIMMILTIAAGSIFTIKQYQEYQSSFFSINDRTFGSTFFILTGFHGIHVIIGTIYLAFNTTSQTISSPKDRLRFEMATWYWHFVDVVWILVFYLLYFLNN